MIKNFLWTNLKARLTFIKSKSGHPYNWLFLPGGPGIDSTSLVNLTSCLTLPGTMWFLDLPGNGTNSTDNNEYYFERWPDILVEVVNALDNVIIVAHSAAGRIVLASPKLKNLLKAVVLIGTAPDASWQKDFIEYFKTNPLPEMDNLQKIYANNPTVENLNNLLQAACPHYFTPAGLSQGKLLFEKLSCSYNVAAFEWFTEHFDKTYKALWVPDNMPALIFAGDQDHIIPSTYFTNSTNFQKKNIAMRLVKDSGHFPWIENPEQVKSLFEEFLTQIEAFYYE